MSKRDIAVQTLIQLIGNGDPVDYETGKRVELVVDCMIDAAYERAMDKVQDQRMRDILNGHFTPKMVDP